MKRGKMSGDESRQEHELAAKHAKRREKNPFFFSCCFVWLVVFRGSALSVLTLAFLSYEGNRTTKHTNHTKQHE
jgi:hypothetical protein